MNKIYLLSLGCPRNLLDSEVLLELLEQKGFALAEVPEDADVAIVNTCGFIEDAKQESINSILQLVDFKKQGKIKKIVVTGCLSQRYPEELTSEIEEIDGMFGTSDFTKIPDFLETVLAGKKVKKINQNPDFLYSHLTGRKILTKPHSVYLKIQEGCSNKCSYCIIPELKGPRRSRSIESVIEEIKSLKSRHDIKELLVIGQDTTSFGLDKSGTSELAELIKKISLEVKEGWVRLLYTHPAHFTDELINVYRDTKNLCKYVDLPIQHINDRILSKMNRRVKKETIVSLVSKIREKVKKVVLRTSVIVGFPGETEEEFNELLGFLKEIKFERLGAFMYSQEEGTPAAEFDDQISQEIKEERFDKIMRLQQEISDEINQKYFDKTLEVLIDEKDETVSDQYIGRTQMDAPDVDGVVYVKGKNLKVGDFAKVLITGTMEYDLIGEAI